MIQHVILASASLKRIDTPSLFANRRKAKAGIPFDPGTPPIDALQDANGFFILDRNNNYIIP